MDALSLTRLGARLSFDCRTVSTMAKIFSRGVPACTLWQELQVHRQAVHGLAVQDGENAFFGSHGVSVNR
jgi:hypothetical protein